MSGHELSRRFVMHVLPRCFHRVHHDGLFADGNRAATIAPSWIFLVIAGLAAPDGGSAMQALRQICRKSRPKPDGVDGAQTIGSSRAEIGRFTKPAMIGTLVASAAMNAMAFGARRTAGWCIRPSVSVSRSPR